MKFKQVIPMAFLMIIMQVSCKQNEKASDLNIVFLHHSTGEVIWNGAPSSLVAKAANKISKTLADLVTPKATLPSLIEKYNEENNTNYLIEELTFPKETPYGWSNFPYDYYNIWVKNAGEQTYMEEPTLEILTKKYQVIIFKHCFPVSNIQENNNSADIDSELKTLPNYKLQYAALKEKLNEFPNTKFILFTGAAQVEANITEDKAKRASDFFKWVKDEWDIPNDNVYLWDLYSLQTEGGLYFKDEYAVSSTNSHPNGLFAGRAVNLLYTRIIDIIENNGNGTLLTGEKK